MLLRWLMTVRNVSRGPETHQTVVRMSALSLVLLRTANDMNLARKKLQGQSSSHCELTNEKTF